MLMESGGEFNGMLAVRVAEEYAEPGVGMPLLLARTGNNGWDTTEGDDAGNPGGATGNDGCSPGGPVVEIGGRMAWTGNKGCGIIPNGAEGTEPAGFCGYHGCGRGGPGHPARGPSNPGLYLLVITKKKNTIESQPQHRAENI